MEKSEKKEKLTMKEATALIEAQEAIINSLNDELERLRLQASQPNRKAAPLLPSGTFEVDGKEYRLIRQAVILPTWGKLTADEIMKRPEVQAHLVEIGSGAIQAV